MTSTWCSTKARFNRSRTSAAIGILKSSPITSAPVCSVRGVIASEAIDLLRAQPPQTLSRQDDGTNRLQTRGKRPKPYAARRDVKNLFLGARRDSIQSEKQQTDKHR